MIEALSTRQLRVRTAWIAAAGATLTVAALLVGVSDNPPGIALAYLAATALVLAVAHPWRTAAPYRWLCLGGVLGFVVMAVLHNLLYALGVMSEGLPALRMLFEVLHVAAFLVAILVCPPAFVVGLVGWVVTSIRTRRRSSAPPKA